MSQQTSSAKQKAIRPGVVPISSVSNSMMRIASMRALLAITKHLRGEVLAQGIASYWSSASQTLHRSNHYKPKTMQSVKTRAGIDEVAHEAGQASLVLETVYFGKSGNVSPAGELLPAKRLESSNRFAKASNAMSISDSAVDRRSGGLHARSAISNNMTAKRLFSDSLDSALKHWVSRPKAKSATGNSQSRSASISNDQEKGALREEGRSGVRSGSSVTGRYGVTSKITTIQRIWNKGTLDDKLTPDRGQMVGYDLSLESHRRHSTSAGVGVRANARIARLSKMLDGVQELRSLSEVQYEAAGNTSSSYKRPTAAARAGIGGEVASSGNGSAPKRAGGRDAENSSQVLNYSPTVIINASLEDRDIERKVLAGLLSHGRELSDLMRREAAKQRRSEF
jgi:hypothetical protein